MDRKIEFSRSITDYGLGLLFDDDAGVWDVEIWGLPGGQFSISTLNTLGECLERELENRIENLYKVMKEIAEKVDVVAKQKHFLWMYRLAGNQLFIVVNTLSDIHPVYYAINPCPDWVEVIEGSVHEEEG